MVALKAYSKKNAWLKSNLNKNNSPPFYAMAQTKLSNKALVLRVKGRHKTATANLNMVRLIMHLKWSEVTIKLMKYKSDTFEILVALILFQIQIIKVRK